MNKIVLSGETIELEKYMNATQIIVQKDSILNSMNLGENLDLHIIIQDDANLTINLFDFAPNIQNKIIVDSYNNSKLILNTSFICENKYELDIETNVLGDNVTNLVNIRGINEKEGFVRIEMNGNIDKDTKNSTLSEYAKIINKSDESNVLVPNLKCDTNLTIANHGVSIASIDKEALNYLKTKGIRENMAIKIIEEGFIESIMDEPIRKRIKNILIGR